MKRAMTRPSFFRAASSSGAFTRLMLFILSILTTLFFASNSLATPACSVGTSGIQEQANAGLALSCEAQKVADKCDEFFEDDSEDKAHFEKTCDGEASDPISKFDLVVRCSTGPIVDSVKSVGQLIAAGMKETEENRAKFVAACETNRNFKFEAARTAPLFANSSEADLERIPCHYLIVEVEESAARERQMHVSERAEASYKRYLSLPKTFEPTTPTSNPLLAIIQHNYDKWRCLNNAGKFEMICYALFSAVDPTLVIGGGAGVVMKGARLAKLFDRGKAAIGTVGRSVSARRLGAVTETSEAAARSVPGLSSPSAAFSRESDFIAFGQKNNCAGNACSAMGYQDLARALNKVRAKLNDGHGVTSEQFQNVTAKMGYRMEDAGSFSGKTSKDLLRFRKAMGEAKDSGRNYVINYGDHMEAIANGKLPDGFLEHYKRTGIADLVEVFPANP